MVELHISVSEINVSIIRKMACITTKNVKYDELKRTGHLD